MNTNMQGHNHSGKSHLLGMLGIGALVLVVLLGTGRSFQAALPFALFLACPLMMFGMMFMMRGNNGQQNRDDGAEHRDHRDHDAPAEWQDSARTSSTEPPKRTTVP
jgi:hypothetical protein